MLIQVLGSHETDA